MSLKYHSESHTLTLTRNRHRSHSRITSMSSAASASASASASGSMSTMAETKRKCSGFSCHQCKTSARTGDELIFCGNMTPKGPRRRRCKKKFCISCMKHYGDKDFEQAMRHHQHMQDQANGIAWDEHDNSADPEFWCPSCRGVCCCMACRRERVSQLPGPEAVDELNNAAQTTSRATAAAQSKQRSKRQNKAKSAAGASTDSLIDATSQSTSPAAYIDEEQNIAAYQSDFELNESPHAAAAASENRQSRTQQTQPRARGRGLVHTTDTSEDMADQDIYNSSPLRDSQSKSLRMQSQHQSQRNNRDVQAGDATISSTVPNTPQSSMEPGHVQVPMPLPMSHLDDDEHEADDNRSPDLTPHGRERSRLQGRSRDGKTVTNQPSRVGAFSIKTEFEVHSHRGRCRSIDILRAQSKANAIQTNNVPASHSLEHFADAVTSTAATIPQSTLTDAAAAASIARQSNHDSHSLNSPRKTQNQERNAQSVYFQGDASSTPRGSSAGETLATAASAFAQSHTSAQSTRKHSQSKSLIHTTGWKSCGL